MDIWPKRPAVVRMLVTSGDAGEAGTVDPAPRDQGAAGDRRETAVVVVDKGGERERRHAADFPGILINAGRCGAVEDGEPGERDIERDPKSHRGQKGGEAGEIGENGVGATRGEPASDTFLIFTGVRGIQLAKGHSVFEGKPLRDPAKAGVKDSGPPRPGNETDAAIPESRHAAEGEEGVLRLIRGDFMHGQAPVGAGKTNEGEAIPRKVFDPRSIERTRQENDTLHFSHEEDASETVRREFVIGTKFREAETEAFGTPNRAPPMRLELAWKARSGKIPTRIDPGEFRLDRGVGVLMPIVDQCREGEIGNISQFAGLRQDRGARGLGDRRLVSQGA